MLPILMKQKLFHFFLVLLSDDEERRVQNNIFTKCKLGGKAYGLLEALEEIKRLPSYLSELATTSCVNSSSTNQEFLSPSTEEKQSVPLSQGQGALINNNEVNSSSTTTMSSLTTTTTNTTIAASGMSSPTSPTVFSRILNTPVNSKGDTFLHLVATEGHCDLIEVLMGYGADPAVR